MTYLDYLNEFHRWLESNHLPITAQVLYFRLLNVFNRAGWPESVQVDTLRLMLMTDSGKDAAYRSRDFLVRAGFITLQHGRRGVPTRYFLSGKPADSAAYCVRNRSTNSAMNPATNPAAYRTTNSATYPATQTATHTKTKKEKKTKNGFPPTPPEPKEENGETLSGFGPELTAALEDWMQYKRERGETVPPTGRRTLLAQVEKEAGKHGETAVAELVRRSIANGWRGIVWEKLEQRPAAHDAQAGSSDLSWMRKCIQARAKNSGEGGERP